jgi:hypothetical protein
MAFPTGPLLISQARASELRSRAFADALLRAIGITIGTFYGIKGAALGFSLATVMSIPLFIGIAGRKGPVSASDQIIAASLAIPLAFGVLVGCYTSDLFMQYFKVGNIYIKLISSAFTSLLFGALLSFSLPFSRRLSSSFVSSIRNLALPRQEPT